MNPILTPTYIPKQMETIIKDKNGKPIKEGEKFRFNYLKNLHELPLNLIGSFDWNDTDLRYEIDIWDNADYVCLSYVGNGVMRDFELIEAEKRNVVLTQRNYPTIEVDFSEKDIVKIWGNARTYSNVIHVERENIEAIITILKSINPI